MIHENGHRMRTRPLPGTQSLPQTQPLLPGTDYIAPVVYATLEDMSDFAKFVKEKIEDQNLNRLGIVKVIIGSKNVIRKECQLAEWQIFHRNTLHFHSWNSENRFKLHSFSAANLCGSQRHYSYSNFLFNWFEFFHLYLSRSFHTQAGCHEKRVTRT